MPSLRAITPDDFETIRRHRLAMFREGGRPAVAIAAMAEPFGLWLRPRLDDGRYFGWIAQGDGGEVAAGIGMMEIDWPPHWLHPTTGRRGYVLNLYVEPQYRRRGLARRMVAAAMDEGRARGLEYMILHPSEQGRPLYESLGWSPTGELGIAVPKA
ncbi:GNAT family N-acetyltransferase [Sphingomonas parva]|uniref:GNAT family N-acetyltransferase n=1 Tax=Sphingomonas parva TaxID=2555898 RepID=A0A4Y8ZPP7_9SPHN|nr:GNAT family N-acetyltransferase [Sphingomonas parva]TFI57978.1 GNAT family N-acetyltransferase [Sphingomonas parva]